MSTNPNPNLAFQRASPPPILTLPSDEEVSDMMGVKVISFYPEDIGGFSPNVDTGHRNIEGRRQNIHALLKRYLPLLDITKDAPSVVGLASARSGHVVTFYDAPRSTNSRKIVGACILKHSRHILPAEDITNTSGINIDLIQSTLSAEELSFISFFHEIGHITQTLKNMFGNNTFRSQFYAELHADFYALTHFFEAERDSAQQDRVIKSWLAFRAVTGFLKGSPQYWIAPCLQQVFQNPESRSGKLSTDIDPYACWKSYCELRVRITLLLGSDTYEPPELENYLWLLGSTDSGLKDLAKQELARFNFQWDSSPEMEQHRKNGNILKALVHVMQHTELDDFTRYCGQQILDGASLLCPSLFNNPNTSPIQEVHYN